jgi:hypothetical protein
MNDIEKSYKKLKKEEIINWVRSQIEAHNEFKAAYNKQLAFDFNWFNFFSLGENKISEILKYFLDPNEKHAQGDVFLQEFLKLFCYDQPDIKEVIEIRTEKPTSEKRRIDLYIRFKKSDHRDHIVAIENKVWAKDQQNQIKDYAKFLNDQSNGNYMLFYLSPYGRPPELSSIQEAELLELEGSGKFKIINYSSDMMNLLDLWISKCEADNVSHFLKQLRRHFKIYFLGNDTLKITAKMEEFVHKNQDEVKALSDTYIQIQSRLIKSINEIGEKFTLDDVEFKNKALGIKFEKAGPFPYVEGSEQRRVYKVGISHGNNKVWIHISQRGLDIVSTHYFEKIKGAEEIIKMSEFEKIFTNNQEEFILNKTKNLGFEKNSDELERIFTDQVNLAIELLRKHFDEK